MEHHSMRDLIWTVYAQYFHKYLKYQHTKEAKIFTYGFLFMGAFLTENQKLVEVYGNQIQQTDLLSDVYVLPAGRKFGVALFYSWSKYEEETFEKVFSEMLQASEIYREASEKSLCSFEYSILEHLIFTDKTERMKYLIENNISQKYHDRDFVPQDRKKIMKKFGRSCALPHILQWKITKKAWRI